MQLDTRCRYACFQLYQRTGKELCITGVNVNMLRVDYFHPKTTPDFQIKKAVKLTVAIPGISLTHKLI